MKTIAVVFLACVTGICFAQQPSPADPTAAIRSANERLMQAAPGNDRNELQDYKVGAEDQLDISVFDVPELSRTVRVSLSGYISMPLIGQIHAAGLTVSELEQEITEQLKKSYMNDPQVAVFVREFKSDPVSVVGSVTTPGTYQIQTPKDLLQVLAMAQGFSLIKPPGREIIVTRKRATARQGQSGEPAAAADTVRVRVADLLSGSDPAADVMIYPGDTVRVEPALSVYVAGDVTKPGAFPLTGFENMSVVQAVAMAGGTVKTAKVSDSVVIHTDEKGVRTEQKVNLKRMVQGKDADFLLHPNDILFVPGSMTKSAALRGIEAGIQISTGLLIWRR